MYNKGVRILYILTLSGILLSVVTYNVSKLRKNNLLLQIIYYIVTLILLCMIYIYTIGYDSLRYTIFIYLLLALMLMTLVTKIFLISLQNKDKKIQNQDKYIHFDNSKSMLVDDKSNIAEKELSKSKDYSAFYNHIKSDVSTYFEEVNGIKSQQNNNYINASNQNYNKAFMNDYDYNDNITNNVGETYNFNPDPENAKYFHQTMRNKAQRNTTDVEKLNKDFIKKYHGKKGI